MPELAEVEYFRKTWDVGVGARISRVLLHPGIRLFRGLDPVELVRKVEGARLLGSEAQGKQMLFRFGRAKKATSWIGIHLGMSGDLRVEESGFAPGKHDHLVLVQPSQSLVFRDPRQFGRVRFHTGPAAPAWWNDLPAPVTAPEFTLERVRGFLSRRPATAVKALLLMQEFFPGVGNWMADEILWRARINPKRRAGRLKATEAESLWHEAREVCRISLKTVGMGDVHPPKGWLFHVRWSAKGICPRCKSPLRTATVGGRTTRWCPKCQSARS